MEEVAQRCFWSFEARRNRRVGCCWGTGAFEAVTKNGRSAQSVMRFVSRNVVFFAMALVGTKREAVVVWMWCRSLG